jgi:hypothetical protein
MFRTWLCSERDCLRIDDSRWHKCLLRPVGHVLGVGSVGRRNVLFQKRQDREQPARTMIM